jgi:copper chaperone NosL
MNIRTALFFATLGLAACDQNKTADMPAPAPYDAAAIGHFCGMALGEHPGPKGQIWVDSQATPYWFTSVHDTIAFTLLPEEPHGIRAIYVSDMAKASSWAHAEDGGWVDAHKAFFVIEGRVSGGMGQAEEVPFSDKAAAEAFTRQNGGRIVSFDDIPKDNILGGPPPGAAPGTTK